MFHSLKLLGDVAADTLSRRVGSNEFRILFFETDKLVEKHVKIIVAYRWLCQDVIIVVMTFDNLA